MKAIFASYNLTDANGRIIPVPINDARGVLASMLLVFVLALLTSLFN